MFTVVLLFTKRVITGRSSKVITVFIAKIFVLGPDADGRRRGDSRCACTGVGVIKIKTETGVNKFVATMNEAFKPADKIYELEIYTNYYIDIKKKGEESIVIYMNRFEKAANFAKKNKMDLPPKAKGCCMTPVCQTRT